MKRLRILVACEESQAVCKAFRELGHKAYSCDLQECSGGHPEWHIKGDALKVLNLPIWDLVIAHPPCTYLSNAGARFLYPKGVLNEERYKKGLEGKDFFMQFFNAKCTHIAIENPVASKIYGLPKHSQEIQPYMFGHPFKKKTRLWLKGLPQLKPTNIVTVSESTKIAGNWFNKGGKERQKNRSKTFEGIAKAMATQWSEYILKELEDIKTNVIAFYNIKAFNRPLEECYYVE